MTDTLNTMWSRTIVLYNGFRDNEPKKLNMDDEDVVPLLTTFPDPQCRATSCPGRKCPAKTSARCWSPVSYADGTARDNTNVVALNYAVFDLDHLLPGALDAVRASLDSEDLEYVIHTTHSHTDEDCCYRLILPLSRAASPSEWPAFYGALIDALSLPADRACSDLARLYALPTARAGVTPFSVHHRGRPLDVDEALQAGGEAARAPVASPPSRSEATDLASLRAHLSSVRRRKASGDEKERAQALLLGRVLDGEALAPIGERHHARVRVTGILSHWLPASTPWETALELMRPCLTATDLDAGETFESALEKTRALYEGSMRYRLESDEKRVEVEEKNRAIVKMLRDRASPTAKDIADAAAAVGVAADGADDAWMSQLLLSKGGVRGCEFNARLLIACAPELRGTIRWNEVAKKIEVRGGPLDGLAADVLEQAAVSWLQHTYEFQGGVRLMRGALLQVALENKYDPIQDYLGEVAWDGVARIDEFLERYLGAVIKDEQHAKYVRAVSRRWLISLVARALRPGCKVDTVLVLEGPQGIKKSTALETLVGPGYFLDTALELGNKDTMQAIAGSWLIELGELASLRRAETEKIKQFISSRTDKYRPPYGATVVDSPRRCVLVGTCNPEEGGGYLKDRTGNRRFWPVRVDEVDISAIDRDRDVVLAEAVAAFRAGERWWLVREEEALAALETEDRVEESTVAEAIERWWYGEQPAKRPRQLQVLDVAQLALQLPVDRVMHGMRVEIGQAMNQLGFRCARKRAGGESRTRLYIPTPEMLSAPVRQLASRAAVLSLVEAVHKRSAGPESV